MAILLGGSSNGRDQAHLDGADRRFPAVLDSQFPNYAMEIQLDRAYAVSDRRGDL